MWLNRTSLELVSLSPSQMLVRYPADAPFIDGGGNAQSNAAWLHNPDLTPVTGVPNKYWVLTGDILSEMDQAAKDAVDAAEAAALVADNRADALVLPDDVVDPIGWNQRALIELLNKRDNYVVNRLTELQAAFDAMKASAGNISSLRDSIPASWLVTATRLRSDAIQDYKDEITSGGADT